jgi:hypothetical protein
MAVLAPIPSASVATATKVKIGDLRSWRKAKRKSCKIMETPESSHQHFAFRNCKAPSTLVS